MPEIETTKKYLLVKRKELMTQLKKDGYSGADIGIIFNVDRSVVCRILANGKPASPVAESVPLAKKQGNL